MRLSSPCIKQVILTIVQLAETNIDNIKMPPKIPKKAGQKGLD